MLNVLKRTDCELLKRQDGRVAIIARRPGKVECWDLISEDILPAVAEQRLYEGSVWKFGGRTYQVSER